MKAQPHEGWNLWSLSANPQRSTKATKHKETKNKSIKKHQKREDDERQACSGHWESAFFERERKRIFIERKRGRHAQAECMRPTFHTIIKSIRWTQTNEPITTLVFSFFIRVGVWVCFLTFVGWFFSFPFLLHLKETLHSLFHPATLCSWFPWCLTAELSFNHFRHLWPSKIGDKRWVF